MPPSKPPITLRRPINLDVADQFVSGAGTQRPPAPTLASVPASLPVEDAPSPSNQGSPEPAWESDAARASDRPQAAVAAVAVAAEKGRGEPAGALRPGIMLRKSGRLRRRSTYYIEPALAMRLAVYCAKNSLDLSDVVEAGLRDHLDALNA